MIPPQDIQVSGVLYFLATALRSDTEIQKITEASPDEIVAQTAEYQPMEKGPGGKIYLLSSQLPCLALHIVDEKEKIVPGTKRGREFTAWLWYLFRPFQSQSHDVHGYTMGERLCSLVWWRIQHWLMYCKLFSLSAGADGPTFDLCETAKIREIALTGNSDRIQFSEVEGIKIPIKVWHGWAPYDEIDPVILRTISLGITAESGSGVSVGATIDVSP